MVDLQRVLHPQQKPERQYSKHACPFSLVVPLDRNFTPRGNRAGGREDRAAAECVSTAITAI
jgi:hypothetical protein